MPNRLANESSPYLLQHQDNPVDWYPWCEEALARAAAEDKPIFLSIGYSACHWCHVMAHESFEDEAIAALLNEKFINIKVDREERPDLDQIYMTAVQIMTQHGGWPMSVFLTPQLQPFFGGTYWPPFPRMGMPGFKQVIEAVDDAWKNRREQALEQAGQLTDYLQNANLPEAATGGLDEPLLSASVARIEREFDATHGGFGVRPKFPHAMVLQFMLRFWKRNRHDGVRDMVRLNLDKMSQGGIYDHLAGGFARYSVDERWLVPHFEKMLYDNALLTGAYLDGFLATGDEHYARVARETLSYICNYMTDDQGGFHSAEDADSEGEEGKFYVWSVDEIKSVLGETKGQRFCYVYDVSPGGNFEGENILNLPKTIAQCAAIKGWDVDELETELAESRQALLEVRDRRVRPGKDDKVLTNWNGLMIDSFARASGILDEPQYAETAVRAADFILQNLVRDDGRLLHTWRNGTARHDAYLDDYTCLINALVSVYQATFDERWIERALQLSEAVLAHFHDPHGGGFFYTADDHEQLIARNKEVQESSVPSGNSMAAFAFWRLGKLTGRIDLLDAARGTMQMASGLVERAPTATGLMLCSIDMAVGPTQEIVLIAEPDAEETKQILTAIRNRYLPNCVLACRSPAATGGNSALDALFSGKTAIENEPTLYVCENFACQSPVHGTPAILDKISSWANE